MAAVRALREYVNTVFRWQRGRRGTGYDKMLLLTAPWPIAFDAYLLRYPEGSEIPPHQDPVSSGRHYRLNLIKLFRSDLSQHSVTRVIGGSRYVLSIGWVLKEPGH